MGGGEERRLKRRSDCPNSLVARSAVRIRCPQHPAPAAGSACHPAAPRCRDQTKVWTAEARNVPLLGLRRHAVETPPPRGSHSIHASRSARQSSAYPPKQASHRRGARASSEELSMIRSRSPAQMLSDRPMRSTHYHVLCIQPGIRAIPVPSPHVSSPLHPTAAR